MTRSWLSIRVELVEGHGQQYWPRPGRIFAAARRRTFKQFADAIDDAFARWDRSHLQEFTLAGGRRLCDPGPDFQTEDEITEDYQRVRLSRLRPGEQFVYVFDLGDDWAHLCTAGQHNHSRRHNPCANQPGNHHALAKATAQQAPVCSTPRPIQARRAVITS